MVAIVLVMLAVKIEIVRVDALGRVLSLFLHFAARLVVLSRKARWTVMWCTVLYCTPRTPQYIAVHYSPLPRVIFGLLHPLQLHRSPAKQSRARSRSGRTRSCQIPGFHFPRRCMCWYCTVLHCTSLYSIIRQDQRIHMVRVRVRVLYPSTVLRTSTSKQPPSTCVDIWGRGMDY